MDQVPVFCAAALWSPTKGQSGVPVGTDINSCNTEEIYQLDEDYHDSRLNALCQNTTRLL